MPLQKTLKILSLIIITSVVTLSCDDVKDIVDVDDTLSFNGNLPDTATNLSIVNSEFDDYNSAQVSDGENSGLIFSSNRNSKGKDFDLIQYVRFGINCEFDSGKITIFSNDSGPKGQTSWSTSSMIDTINSSNNEFGPYFHQPKQTGFHSSFEGMLFYTQEVNNQLDIKFWDYRLDSINDYRHYLSNYGPLEASKINTAKHNEGYISIANNNVYFSSDKENDFNIYCIKTDTSKRINEFLTSNYEESPTFIDSVNSLSDDKCPFVLDSIMVFTSDRPGGFGGFDLWYSKLDSAGWCSPINFGPKVNSSNDEYRPIIFDYSNVRFYGAKDQNQNMMIFSSNREGGKGGFDLYFVKTSFN